MSLLQLFLVGLTFLGVVYRAADAIYRIATKADVEEDWETRAILDIVTLVFNFAILLWMKAEGWW